MQFAVITFIICAEVSAAYLFLLRTKTGMRSFIDVGRDCIFAVTATLFMSTTLEHIDFVSVAFAKVPTLYRLIVCTVVIPPVIIYATLLSHGVLTAEKKKRKRYALAADFFLFILGVLGMAALTGTLWGKDAFGEISPEQMIINLFSPTDGTDPNVYRTLISGPVAFTLVFAVIFGFICLSNHETYLHIREKSVKILPLFGKRILCLIMSLLIGVGGLAYGIKEFRLIDLYRMYFIDSDFIDSNYADPRTTRMQFPQKKRNLIHIYLESMENTYLSKELGGACEENLIEPLSELAKDGYVFSNSDYDFGGPTTTRGCTWSVASMVNMHTGFPMRVPVDGNSYGSPGNFLPGAVALGDILAAQGYEQTVMFGASAKFGGLLYYFQDHGGYTVFDYEEAKRRKLISESYKQFWGFEDDKLYEYAKAELTRLYETGKPFNFVMETADTHAPEGYVSKNMPPRKRSSQYADVIAFSSSETARFVEWIRSQPFYENTTVILIGDHESMNTSFFKDIDESYKRTTFNLILNPAESIGDIPRERLHNRWWFNCDMFPTILASIGVKIEGERLGLGTNLFSAEPTLFEKYGGEEGWKTAEREFKYKSDYYNDVILSGELKPFDNKNVTYYQ